MDKHPRYSEYCTVCMHSSHSVHTALYSWDTIQILHHRSHLGELNLSLPFSLSLTHFLSHPSLSPPSIPPSLPPCLFSLPPSLSRLPLCCGQRTGKEAGVCGWLFQCERTSCLCLVPWQDRPQRWEQERVGVCLASCQYYQVLIMAAERKWRGWRLGQNDWWHRGSVPVWLCFNYIEGFARSLSFQMCVGQWCQALVCYWKWICFMAVVPESLSWFLCMLFIQLRLD